MKVYQPIVQQPLRAASWGFPPRYARAFGGYRYEPSHSSGYDGFRTVFIMWRSR